MDAQNTRKVFDWLWTSGQLSEKDIRELPSLGIAAAINLALPASSNALPHDAEYVTGQGLAYIQIPVEWGRPDPAKFALFVGLLKAFADRKVWVHCAMNMRVSAFIFLYRKLVLRESEDIASPMGEIREPDETWRLFIDRVTQMYLKGEGKQPASWQS